MISLIAACAWFIIAAIFGFLPSRDNHWTRAYILMALCAPLCVWLWWDQGYRIVGLFLIGAVSVLRWPIYYLWRWLKSMAKM